MKTNRVRNYVVFAAFVAAFLLFVSSVAPATKHDVPCDVMTVMELRQALKDTREENYALKKEITSLKQDIEILAQGHITSWVNDDNFAWALFGTKECYWLAANAMTENKCEGFMIYTEALKKELNLESGEVKY